MLYLGTETGIFVSLDRGASWRGSRRNLPTVRVDEITLHPRDNAMLRGDAWPRALDSRSSRADPGIRRGAGVDRGRGAVHAAAARCQWEPERDRNDEFWGHQIFFGENPPHGGGDLVAVKKPATSVALTVTDSAGRQVREISGPALANSTKAGIQSACWDLRVQPVPRACRPRPAAARHAARAPDCAPAQRAGTGAGGEPVRRRVPGGRGGRRRRRRRRRQQHRRTAT